MNRYLYIKCLFGWDMNTHPPNKPALFNQVTQIATLEKVRILSNFLKNFPILNISFILIM